jgi:propanediol dehydratase small subunit
MQTYEMLRPGRANAEILRAQANLLRTLYSANLIADFIEEAAAVYARRNIFAKRY